MFEAKPLLIISVVMLIGSIALFYFFTTPLIEESKSQDSRIEQLQYELDNTTDYFNEVKENAERLDNSGWSDIEKKIDANFMSGPFFVYNMKNYINNLVVGSGLYLKDLTIEGVSDSFLISKSNGEEDGKLTEVGITIEASGSYESFENFLYLTEQQVAIINIKSFSVTSSEDNNLSFSIKGNIYSE